jgi:hypothetical protein
MVLSASTQVVKHIAGVPGGDRTVVDVTGGTFSGPRLSGRIPASGGDWLTRVPSHATQDVRLLLETDDGVTILFRYTGRAGQRDGKPRIEVAGSFDAPTGAYEWLNTIQAFGLGTPTHDGVRYDFFYFR